MIHLIACVLASTVVLGTLKFGMVAVRNTRALAMTNYKMEFRAHQCGRAIAFMKNIQAAAKRVKKTSHHHHPDPDPAPDSQHEPTDADLRAKQLNQNLTLHYGDRYGFQDMDCIENSTGVIIAKAYLLNADEDDPETGYYAYRIQNLSDGRYH
jgi:hypothetical protein